MNKESREEAIFRIRKNLFLASYVSGSGHLGSSLSCVEILYALYAEGERISHRNGSSIRTGTRSS